MGPISRYGFDPIAQQPVTEAYGSLPEEIAALLGIKKQAKSTLARPDISEMLRQRMLGVQSAVPQRISELQNGGWSPMQEQFWTGARSPGGTDFGGAHFTVDANGMLGGRTRYDR